MWWPPLPTFDASGCPLCSRFSCVGRRWNRFDSFQPSYKKAASCRPHCKLLLTSKQMKSLTLNSAALLLALCAVCSTEGGLYVQRGASYPFPRPLNPPTIPPFPAIPAIPAMPAMPAIPAIPAVPSIFTSFQPRITNSGPVRPVDGVRWPLPAGFQPFPAMAVASTPNPRRRNAKKTTKKIGTSVQASAVAVASSGGKPSSSVVTSVSG